MVTNAAGIRSDREYAREVPPEVFRILVFGDSYAAGQFVSNDHRFSELLERRVQNLEVMNFALEGTGTDQQLLLYEQVAAEYEHHLVMVFPFLQNIRRNLVEARVAFDAKTGERLLRGKPRFDLCGGDLVLKNSPVPATVDSPDDSDEPISVDAQTGALQGLKTAISQSPLGHSVKSLLYTIRPWEPFPEYRQASTPAWRLMEAILRRFADKAAPRPLVIVPVFYDSYVRYRMARNYWDRFHSLQSCGTHVIDLLPHLRRLGSDAPRCFQVPHDCHFSSYGHLVIAEALQAELEKRELLK